MNVATFDWIANPAPRRPQRWLRVVAYGILWGVASSAMESVVLPMRGGNGLDIWAVLVWILPGWCLVGVGIAAFVELAGERLEAPAFVAIAVVVGAVVFSALWSWIYSHAEWPDHLLPVATQIPHKPDPFAAFLYQAWVVAFYGGLYIVAWRFNQRAERARRMLGQAELARLKSETMLGEIMLDALRGHVDPDFLLRVMEEVEHRYATEPASADRLIGLLVAFLRVAMPGMHTGNSTLAGELRLVDAYAELWAELEHARATWTIHAPEALPGVAFPPLLLLPVLDHLAAASRRDSRGDVSVVSNDEGVEIRFDCAALDGSDLLNTELAYRIRVGLSTLYGDAWSLVVRKPAGPDGPALVLSLGPWPRARPTSSEQRSLSPATRRTLP